MDKKSPKNNQKPKNQKADIQSDDLELLTKRLN
jgi:hypothetical protein